MSLNNNEKFPHLSEIKPSVKDIMDTPIEFIDQNHLNTLSSHFQNIKEKNSFDTEIVDATNSILSKIDNIIGLWSAKISWEIMKAANDDNYYKTLSI